jgi:hypothetical protein
MEPPHHQTSRLIPLPQRSGWVDELYSQIIVDRLEQSVRIGTHETDLRDDIKRHLSKLLIKVPSRTLQEVLDPITSRAWIAEFQNETSLQVLQLGKSYQDADVLKRYKTHLANPPETSSTAVRPQVVTIPREPFARLSLPLLSPRYLDSVIYGFARFLAGQSSYFHRFIRSCGSPSTASSGAVTSSALLYESLAL